MHLNATALAAKMTVSKARVSQWTKEGKLAGCFTGEGRARLYDLDAVSRALGKTLDPAQMLGNGATTRRALRDIDAEPTAAPRPATPRASEELPPNDPDRYTLARAQIAEEDARRKRRDNEQHEGRWVMAEEVQRQTARAMVQEIAQFEAVLRDGARAIADKLGVDYRTARQVLLDQWRDYRAKRATTLGTAAESAPMTDAEQGGEA